MARTRGWLQRSSNAPAAPLQHAPSMLSREPSVRKACGIEKGVSMTTNATRRPSRVLAAAVMAVLLTGVTPAHADPPSTGDVLTFSDGTVVGSSRLVRTGSGISASIQTSGLTPDDVVTVWIVVFNHPENCATSPCTADDRLDPDVDAHAVYGTGHVVGGTGTAGYGLHLNVGDASREDLWGSGPALTDPLGAEIHLVLRTHGQRQPGNVNNQSHSANLGCNPQCVNVQFSRHLPAT